MRQERGPKARPQDSRPRLPGTVDNPAWLTRLREWRSCALARLRQRIPAWLRIWLRSRLETRLDTPTILLAGLLLVGFVTVVTHAHLYGISVDEPLQQSYGESVLAWYRTLGKDTSFLTAFPTNDYMPEHGGVFDAGIAALQALFSGADPWLVRHLATGLFGLLGVVAIALCGYELGGGWVAFAAALGLWLYPRYYGAIYNNPKDVPAAATMTFVLWATLLLVKHWRQPEHALRAALLLGVLIGVAAAIRVNAVTWYAVLALLLAGWWVAHGATTWREGRLWSLWSELARQTLVAGAVGASSLLAMMLLWPYVALDPAPNLLHAIQVMRSYPWNGLVLYAGGEYSASQLPATYVPAWLVIGSPPVLTPLALAGIVLGIGSITVSLLRRRRRAFAERPDAQPEPPPDTSPDARLAVALLAFIVPLALLVGLHPVLYDTLRQFLYVVPPMILLAAFGLVHGARWLWRHGRVELRWAAGLLLAVTLASYALVAAEMVALLPFEYTYFSPLVGDLPGAAGAYDTDYWATCGKPASEWLAAHYRSYTGVPYPSVEGPVIEGTPMQTLIAPYLPATFREDDTHPDFVIATTRDHNDLSYPTYTLIHTVAAEGVRLCVVKARPGSASGG